MKLIGKLLLLKTDKIDSPKYNKLISDFQSILFRVNRKKGSRKEAIEVINYRRKLLFEYSPLGLYRIKEIVEGKEPDAYQGFIVAPLPSKSPLCFLHEDEVIILDE